MSDLRLWHYEMLKYLPKTQLKNQWSTLCSIFKNHAANILINYVYDYPKENLYAYTRLVIEEMRKRGYEISCETEKLTEDYFNDITIFDIPKYGDNPFPGKHTDEYLKICYFVLKEYYLRGQRDFSMYIFDSLSDFVSNRTDGTM